MTDIENNQLWQDADKIAGRIYGLLDEFPEEEKFGLMSKLRNASGDLIFYIASALAVSSKPSISELDWCYAQRALAVIKTGYRFAGKQDIIDLDPKFMLRLQELEQAIDQEGGRASKSVVKERNEDIKHWQLKYRLWKESNNER